MNASPGPSPFETIEVEKLTFCKNIEKFNFQFTESSIGSHNFSSEVFSLSVPLSHLPQRIRSSPLP